ncbi:proto-oncogene tyrosine-protein kinase ROS, partial [Aphis craccivora]
FHGILLSLLVSRAIEAYTISTHTRSLLIVSDHEIFERSTELMDTPVTVLSTNQTIKEDIGQFLIDHLKSQLLVLLSKDNTIISVSFDGKDVIDIRNNTQEALFNDSITLSYVNELFYWSNGIRLMGEDYYIITR